MSLDWPWKPELGWWMRIRAFGRASRLPSVPPARISEAADMAMP
jgi:hypothetical protein